MTNGVYEQMPELRSLGVHEVKQEVVYDQSLIQNDVQLNKSENAVLQTRLLELSSPAASSFARLPTVIWRQNQLVALYHLALDELRLLLFHKTKRHT